MININEVKLTEPLLKKYGFRKIGEYIYSYEKLGDDLRRRFLAFRLYDGKFVPVVLIDKNHPIVIGKMIEFEHQLQNLYFSLHHEELVLLK